MYCPPNYREWYPKYRNFVHCHVHQCQTLDTIFSEMNPVLTTLHLFLRFTSVIILSRKPGCVARSLWYTHLSPLEIFSFRKRSNWLRCAASLEFNGYQGLFPGSKSSENESAHSSPSSTVATVQPLSSLPHTTSWCGVKLRTMTMFTFLAC
jgi:hypothetical protein